MGTPVNIRVLKNGQVRIHWFVRDPKGPIRTGASAPFLAPGVKPLVLGGKTGYLACQPKLRSLTSPIAEGKLQPIPCSSEPAAVTCPECRGVPQYREACEAIANANGQLRADDADRKRKTPAQPQEAAPILAS